MCTGRTVAALSLLASMLATEPVGAAGARTFDAALKSFNATFEPSEAKPGDLVTLTITLSLADGWHTYPSVQTDPKAKPFRNRFTIESVKGLEKVGKLSEPPNPEVKPEPDLGIKRLLEYRGTATWKQEYRVTKDAPNGLRLPVVLRPQICDENGCLPPKPLNLNPTLKVIGGAQTVDPKERSQGDATKSRVDLPDSASSTNDARKERLSTQVIGNLEDKSASIVASSGTLSLIFTGAAWGFISLLTPCVFPMIPITVSAFLKQGGESVRATVQKALIYCLTIVVVLTSSAFGTLFFFKELSINPYMNAFLGLLFVVFAMSLFGMYDLTLPSSLQRFTSSREKGGGVLGTVFMALTFSVISFTCVAPFLGGFAGIISSGQYSTVELGLAGLSYATAFASPFFVLAVFPALLKKLPRSGGWMTTLKVVMGFLEMAAALKFFRTAEIVMGGEVTFFTYDVVMSVWVAISIITGLYLFNAFRLPHDTPVENISVTRMLFGLSFVGLAFYILPATINAGDSQKRNQPGGVVFEWIDAFLLPEQRELETEAGADLLREVEEARTAAGKPESGKQLIFVDFTGKSCTNCRKNERNVFEVEPFKSLLSRYRVVQLYTDVVPMSLYDTPPTRQKTFDDAELNRWFQKAAFQSEELPLYVILKPVPGSKKIIIVSRHRGLINDKTAFEKMLREPLEAAGVKLD